MNIHKTIKIAGLGLMAGILSCCISLEEDPRNFIAPSNFYKTEADALAAVTAAYRPFTEFSYYLVMHVLVDNASDNSNEGRANLLARDIDQFTHDSGNGQILNMWGAIYSAVNAANAVTEFVPNIQMNAAQREQIIGEAKFLRALSYFNLVRLFGAVPLHTNPTTSAEEASLPRTPADDVYAQIIRDLEDATAVLPASYPPQFHGRATQSAAQALLASVHLTRGNWAEARDYAKDVIDAMPNSIFPDIEGLWLVANEDGAEFIFSIQAMPDVGVPNFLTQRFKPRIVGGTAIGWVELDFFNSFQPDDARKEVSIYTSVINRNGQSISWPQWSDPYPHIGKYRYGHSQDIDVGQSETNLLFYDMQRFF